MKTILDVVAELREADPPLEYLGPEDSVAHGRFLEFETAFWNGVARVVPSEALNLPGRPGDRSFVYRGHTEKYPTCRSSLFRDCPDDERQVLARVLLQQVRVAELELLLESHPFTHVANKHGYPIDYCGLAQHYGIPTSLLDLTSQIEIAAFFAVAQWDDAKESFAPMTAGAGVILRLDWSAFGPGYARFFNPVGIGPGLRPARQHAWTFNMKPGVDFLRIPHLSTFEFQHSREASEAIFARFGRGRWLYPPDCLASLVQKLAKLPFITTHGMRHAARQDAVQAELIEAHVQSGAALLNATLGLAVLDGVALELEENDLDLARQQAPIVDEGLRSLRRGFRLVRTLRSAEPNSRVDSQAPKANS